MGVPGLRVLALRSPTWETQVGTVRSENGGDPATAVLTGYVVITAADADDAARLAVGCPGLRNGVSVEVGEIAAA
jgi:hypothetical protein